MSDDEDPIGSASGFDNAGGTFGEGGEESLLLVGVHGVAQRQSHCLPIDSTILVGAGNCSRGLPYK